MAFFSPYFPVSTACCCHQSRSASVHPSGAVDSSVCRQLPGAADLTIPQAQPLLGDWAPDTRAFPASFAQSRLWFLQQVQPDLTAYHIPLLWRLRGPLNVAALENALAGLIERHPTLRTSFELRGSTVLQLIHPPAPIHLRVQVLGDRDPDAVIQAWQQQEAATPFDLSSGNLLRARLLAITEQEHILLINHHHIASDGWSLSRLTRDLTALYNAHHNGHPPALQPLGLHYHDYAVWQRQLLNGPQLQTLHDYWIPQLTGLEPLELPTDHPRPATPSYRGADLSVSIEPSLLQPFEELCRSQGATLQMGLLALVALLLHRTSRQDDLAIGIPIWGRNHPDLEPLIGFFINTLPIRTHLSPDLSFRQLLDQVAATSLAAYDHQDLPFEQMGEALNLRRGTSRNPLVQVILQFNNLEDHSLTHLHGLEVDSLNASGHAARFDLEFFLSRQQAGGIAATITYSTDLFSADRIQRLASHLLTLLASAIAAPDAPAASLNLLPDSERQLIESWQHGPSIAIPDLCVHQLFEQQVDRTPEAIALVFEDQKITYGELNARANQLAHYLISLGVGPDNRVAIAVERSLEMVVGLLAILKSGGAYVPLDPAYPSERLAFMLEDSAPLALLVHGATRDRMASLAGTVPMIEVDADATAWVELSDANPETAFLGLKSNHLAYVIYTSGSTGTPKGVMVEHRGVCNLVSAQIREFLLGSSSSVLQFASFSFDAFVMEAFNALCSGAVLHLPVPETKLAGEALVRMITDHGITHALLSPSVLATLPQGCRLTTLGYLLAGGERLPETLVRCWATERRLINAYGPTEATVCATLHPCLATACGDPPIGRPIANTRIYLLDRDGQPVPIGVTGEIHIGSAGVARGYLNRPELTAERFLPDAFAAEPVGRMYRTGDLAQWLPDGNLGYIGRADFQVKIRGFRIELGEIEAALRSSDGIHDAVVLAREDLPGDKCLVAYVVADPNLSPADVEVLTSQLKAHLHSSLPDYMIPSAFVALEAFPLTPNGKLDRRALPVPSFAGDLGQRVPPGTPMERQLHSLWSEVLAHSDFGIHDNFWLLGGHSLAAARLAARIEQTLGTTMPLALLFSFPTLAAQAAWLLNPAQPAPNHLVSLQPLGSRPPLYILHGWGGKVDHFAPLARALAPLRPVFGLQASPDEQPPTQAGLNTLADTYAQEILDVHPGGPIHLMGYSAGGWYAYAVAAALLQRQAPLGLLAIFDSHPITPIHRWLGLALFSRILGSRLLPHLLALLHPPQGQRRSRYALNRIRSLNISAGHYLRLRLPRPRDIKARLRGNAAPPPDPYIQLLKHADKPPRLPLQVDLFAPEDQLPILSRLWRFYAKRGVRSWPLFDNHFDFFKPQLAPQLADALEHTLQLLESTSSTHQHPHDPGSQASAASEASRHLSRAATGDIPTG